MFKSCGLICVFTVMKTSYDLCQVINTRFEKGMVSLCGIFCIVFGNFEPSGSVNARRRSGIIPFLPLLRQAYVKISYVYAGLLESPLKIAEILVEDQFGFRRRYDYVGGHMSAFEGEFHAHPAEFGGEQVHPELAGAVLQGNKGPA